MTSITNRPIALQEVGRYQHPDRKRYDLWYRCPKRSCLVYLEFVQGWKSDKEIQDGLDAAIKMNTCAITATRRSAESTEGSTTQFPHARDHLEFTECQFKTYQPHFNSNCRAVDHEELTYVRTLKQNVVVVSFSGDKFVYKFMTPKCYQNTFETEVDNYKKLEGVEGIPLLKAVVRKAGCIQGFLMYYIEGTDLWSAVQKKGMWDEQLLVDITHRIIRLAARLELRKFYHEDLKCENIVRRDVDGEIFFIDFGGGWTEGMYREERIQYIWFKGLDSTDALFNLGRTIWELWTAKHPSKYSNGAPLDHVENEMVRNIIRDCNEGNVENIDQLCRRYSQQNLLFSKIAS